MLGNLSNLIKLWQFRNILFKVIILALICNLFKAVSWCFKQHLSCFLVSEVGWLRSVTDSHLCGWDLITAWTLHGKICICVTIFMFAWQRWVVKMQTTMPGHFRVCLNIPASSAYLLIYMYINSGATNIAPFFSYSILCCIFI